jgi:hypothetical protein
MMVMGACRVDDRFGLWFVVVVAEEFKSYFAGFGSVLEHQIMQDHSTGRSRAGRKAGEQWGASGGFLSSPVCWSVVTVEDLL